MSLSIDSSWVNRCDYWWVNRCDYWWVNRCDCWARQSLFMIIQIDWIDWREQIVIGLFEYITLMNYYIKNKSIKKEEKHRKNNSVMLQDHPNDQQSFNSYKQKIRENSDQNVSFNHNSLIDKKDKNQYFLQEIQECIKYFDGRKDRNNGCDNLINNPNTAIGSKQILDSQQTRDYYELLDEVRQLKD